MAAILNLSNMAATEGAHLGSLEKLVGDGYYLPLVQKLCLWNDLNNYLIKPPDYLSNAFDQRFRKLNPPSAHRSQIKICEKRQTRNVQFRFMPNAFRILKPILKSSKRV